MKRFPGTTRVIIDLWLEKILLLVFVVVVGAGVVNFLSVVVVVELLMLS